MSANGWNQHHVLRSFLQIKSPRRFYPFSKVHALHLKFFTQIMSWQIYQYSVEPFSYLACNEFVYLVYQGRQFYKSTPLRKKESLWNWMKLLYCHTSISLYPDWLLLSWKVQQTPTQRAFRRTFRHRQNAFHHILLWVCPKSANTACSLGCPSFYSTKVYAK